MPESVKYFILSSVRFFITLIPIKKGKQTLCHYLVIYFFKNFSFAKLVKINSTFIWLDFSDRMQAMYFLTGLYEPQTILAAGRVLANKNAPVYLDVGANVGLMGLQIFSRHPTIKAHLFEPDPKVFQALSRNIAANSLNQFKLNNLAVSDRSDTRLRFSQSLQASESGWGRLQNQNNSKDLSIEVNCQSLDDYLNLHSISEVDLLKIDVEGAEMQVLKGALTSLKGKKIKNIICEINEEALAAFGNSGQDIKDFLSELGFIESSIAEMNSVFYLPS